MARRSVNSGKNALTANFDVKVVNELMDELNKGIKESLRPAAQAGAQVYYDAILSNPDFPKSEHAHYFYGTHGVYGPYSPGTLRNAIYQVWSKDRSDENKAVYQVSWNYKEAPYGFMVEFGTSSAKAHAFLGPALGKAQQAIDAVEERLTEELLKRGLVDA